MGTKTILLANPRGFCAGVERAIGIVESALQQYGKPIYVRHEVVHNRYVVNNLREKGAVFVDELDEVPQGATVIFSAHGVSLKVREEAEKRGLRIFDATCPLVTKVHLQVKRMYAQGKEIIMIGHKGHPEVEATMGQISQRIQLIEKVADIDKIQVKNPDNLFYVTQTTLSMDDAQEVIHALQQRFPKITSASKGDICYATQNRQDAVKKMVTQVDAVFVVGSPNSSNSNRLREVALKRGVDAWLIDQVDMIDPNWLIGKQRIGITAGASAPEVLITSVIERLKQLGIEYIENMPDTEERVVFALPKALK